MISRPVSNKDDNDTIITKVTLDIVRLVKCQKEEGMIVGVVSSENKIIGKSNKVL